MSSLASSTVRHRQTGGAQCDCGLRDSILEIGKISCARETCAYPRASPKPFPRAPRERLLGRSKGYARRGRTGAELARKLLKCLAVWPVNEKPQSYGRASRVRFVYIFADRSSVLPPAFRPSAAFVRGLSHPQMCLIHICGVVGQFPYTPNVQISRILAICGKLERFNTSSSKPHSLPPHHVTLCVTN